MNESGAKEQAGEGGHRRTSSSSCRIAIRSCWSTASSTWTATARPSGIKNVTVNEPYFQGHFPGNPVMPGVLLIEGMAQTAGALCMRHLEAFKEPPLVYFMAIDKARFRRPVIPGDTVHYHVQKMRNRGRVWRFRAQALVDGVARRRGRGQRRDRRNVSSKPAGTWPHSRDRSGRSAR